MPKPSRFTGFASHSPLSTAASSIVRRLANLFGERLETAIEKPSVRAVHDARVAARRLRTALRTFEDDHPSRSHRRALRSVRRLGRSLGRVRDADVHLAALWPALSGATPAERPGIQYAIEALETQRRHAMDRLRERARSFEPAVLAQRDDG